MARFEQKEIDRLYGQSTVGVIIHRDLVVLYANDAYARMMGCRDAAEFMAAPDLVRYIPPAFHLEALRLYKQFMEATGFHGWKKVYNLRQDGSPVWLEISDETIEWEDGRALLTTAQMIENGTTAMQVDHMLGRSFIGVAVHRDMQALYVNDAFACVMGAQSASDFMKKPDLLRFVDVANRDKTLADSEKILQGVVGGERRRECRFLDDGSEVWCDLTDERILWHDGRPAVLTTAHDVREEVRMNNMLVRNRNSLENAVAEVIRMVPTAVAMFDEELHVLHFNREFARLFAQNPGVYPAATPEFDVSGLRAIYRDMVRAGHDHADRNGVMSPSARLTDIRINRLQGGGMMVSALDVTDHKEVEKQLAVLASTDPLTEVLNRRGFEGAVSRLHDIRRLRNKTWHYGIAVLDLDYFKLVNDRFGHACGDRVLQEVAAVLRGALRDDDLVVRLGGEEFAVFLPSATAKITQSIAERLAGMINDIRLSDDEGNFGVVKITASIGVTIGGDVCDDPKSEIDLPTALLVADRALYQAKQAGRNRIVYADPTLPAAMVLSDEAANPADEGGDGE
ncbi:sensor domain-containing diguanylate cyclase [Thalassospira marina]|uniref:diguanylate cyclase n=1 Tax=Thalassospira marina TaxID=2048283 RepID=A0ABN5FEC3_9PROT|nr:diguanylate cyclase [Thalassospira marina]AUG52670.1 GGDEF domain-containing protein [Thalassospira marina]